MNKIIYLFTLLICTIFLFGHASSISTDIHLESFKINNTNNTKSIYYGQEIEFDILIKNYSIEHSNKIPNLIVDATYDDGNHIILKEIVTNDSLYLLRTRLISYDYKNKLEIPNRVNICVTIADTSEKLCNRLQIIDPFILKTNTKFDFVNNKLLLDYDIQNLTKKIESVKLQIDYYLPSGKNTITETIRLAQNAINRYSNELSIQNLLEKNSLEKNIITVCQKLFYDYNTSHIIDTNCTNISIQKAIPVVTKVDLWPEIIYVDSKIKCNPEFYFGKFPIDELNISYQWTHSGKTYNSFNDVYDCTKQKCRVGDTIDCKVKLNVKTTEYSNELKTTKIVQDFPNIDQNSKTKDLPVINIDQNQITNDDNKPILIDQNQITTITNEPEKEQSIFRRFWNWIVNLFS